MVRDVSLLNERVVPRHTTLLEIGCATGDFARYVRRRHRGIRYYGVDISRPAVARAREKYPGMDFTVVAPDEAIAAVVARLMPRRPSILFAKDVLVHQPDPLACFTDWLRLGSEIVIARTRTRDVGPTERDPARSRQWHYGGWMPYIVSNLDELIACANAAAPDAEIVVYRHHVVLGGWNARELPPECADPATGTAETAVGVFRVTDRPGHVTVEDRAEAAPHVTVVERFARRVHALLRRSA